MPSTGTVRGVYADINESFIGLQYPTETIFIEGPRGIRLLLWVDDTSIQVHSLVNDSTIAKLIRLDRNQVISNHFLDYQQEKITIVTCADEDPL